MGKDWRYLKSLSLEDGSTLGTVSGEMDKLVSEYNKLEEDRKEIEKNRPFMIRLLQQIDRKMLRNELKRKRRMKIIRKISRINKYGGFGTTNIEECENSGGIENFSQDNQFS